MKLIVTLAFEIKKKKKIFWLSQPIFCCCSKTVPKISVNFQGPYDFSIDSASWVLFLLYHPHHLCRALLRYRPPQIVPLWYVDHFELKATETFSPPLTTQKFVNWVLSEVSVIARDRFYLSDPCAWWGKNLISKHLPFISPYCLFIALSAFEASGPFLSSRGHISLIYLFVFGPFMYVGLLYIQN